MGINDNRLAGSGVKAAERLLERRGCSVITTGWTCPAGTADIIACEGDTLIFAEVRTRRDDGEGFPATENTADRRSRFERIALAFLAGNAMADMTIRFDLLDVVVMGDGGRALIRHHLAAVSAA